VEGTTGASVYEMRAITTAEDRAAVKRLVEERNRWLAARLIAGPGITEAGTTVPEEALTVGLYEDDQPVGCLRLQRQPRHEAHWAAEPAEPSLLLSFAHSTPGRASDRIGQLMSIWAQDFAARLGMASVRCEIPGSPAVLSEGHTPGRLLRHLRDRCGWQIKHYGRTPAGRPVALLQLPALAHPGLAPLILCRVPLTIRDAARAPHTSIGSQP
jgi:hypothetical protein